VNAQLNARQTYAAAVLAARKPRSAEYELLARVTHALKAAAGFAALACALHENRKLWTALSADIADPGNQLPAALRARLFYLSEFTRQHSSKVLAGEGDAGVLIDINTAVMRGLEGSGGAR